MRKFKYFLNNLGIDRKIGYWLVIITLIFLLPLTYKGIPSGHDLSYHLSRIQGSYELMKSGVFPTLVLPGFYFNLGYPVGIFYPTGILYVASFLIILGIDTISSYKILIILISFLTSLSMYISSYGIFKSKNIAILSTTILTFSIYRGVTDLFARGALGEYIAFIFIPLAFWGMYIILNEREASIAPLIIGMSGLILTHAISVIIVAILLGFMLLIGNWSLFFKQIIKKILLSILMVIFLTAYYWLPMVEMMLSDTFQYQNPWTSLAQNVITDYRQLFYIFISFNLFPYGYEIWWYIGILSLIICFNSVYFKNKFITYISIGFLGLFIFTCNIIPIDYLNFANFMQFPWRVFIIMSIFGAWLIGYGISLVKSKLHYFLFNGIQVFSIVLFLASSFYFINISMKDYIETTFSQYSKGYFFAEFLPEGLDMNKLSNLDKQIVSSNSIIIDYKQELLSYNIYFNQGEYSNTILELPSLYYNGYAAYYVNDDSSGFLEISKSNNGLISIDLDMMNLGKIYVFYNGTRIQKYSLILSALTAFLCLFFIAFSKLKGENRR